MSKPFMSLHVIVKNGEKTIKKMLDSVVGVFDEVVIVDTGSTDKTISIVSEHFDWGVWNAEPHQVLDHPHADTSGFTRHVRLTLAKFDWVDDFSAARQYAYDLGTAKWRFYLDADDEASCFANGALRKEVENTDKNHPDVNCLSIGYRYTEDGGMVQDKLGRGVRWADGWQWADPIHEHLVRHPAGARGIAVWKHLVVNHQHAEQQRINDGFERNLRITEKWYGRETDPKKKALAAYYLAGHTNEMKQLDAARKYWREAADGLGRTNIACEGLCRWARMELKQGNNEKAVALAGEAISKAPELPDGLAVMGVALQLTGEPLRAAGMFDLLRAQPKPSWESQHDAIWLDGLVNIYAAQAYYACGRIDDARKAIAAIPKGLVGHPEVHEAGREINAQIGKSEGYARLHALWEYLMWNTEGLKAQRLLEEFAPSAISDAPFVKQLLRQTQEKMPQMKDWNAYQRTYAGIPDEPYHVPQQHRQWTLLQGRARLVAQWASSLPKEGEKLQVLVIGVQDGIIEGQMLENNPRIVLTACDVAPQASRGINELKARFPGRVKTHQVLHHHYDWFPEHCEPYDAVILFEVLEHLPDDETALKQIMQFLKPDGKLFLSTPISEDWVEPYLSNLKDGRPAWHVRSHNPTTLWKLFQKLGFTGSLMGLGTECLFLATMKPHPLGVFPKAMPALKPISIYVYPLGAHGFDPFSPISQHVGGSEEAVIHLAASLAKKGVSVTVYGDMPARKDRIFVHEGVQWRPLSEFDVASIEGTLFVWRSPQLAAQFKKINPRVKTVMWAHDVFYTNQGA